MPFILFDGNEAARRRPLPTDETDVALYHGDARFGLVVPLKHADLKGQDELQVAYYFQPGGRIQAYMSQHGQLIGRAISPSQSFSTAQVNFGIAAESSEPVQVTLKKIIIQTP